MRFCLFPDRLAVVSRSMIVVARLNIIGYYVLVAVGYHRLFSAMVVSRSASFVFRSAMFDFMID